jgi:hypothetical protein
MSTGMKILLGVGLVGFLFVVTVAGIVIGFNNDCVTAEAGIKKQYEQNQNNYANYFNKLKELAQVPDQYASDLEKVYLGAIQGRYGKDGSTAVVQMIQEQNPNLDPGMYRQIMQVIEAGRNAFEADQKMLIERKTDYADDKLKRFPGSVLAGLLRFPTIDLDKYGIVINDETHKAFETKRAGPIKLRD